MKILSKLTFSLIAILFLAISCGKDNDIEENIDNLPKNETEAFELITEKWGFPNSSEYNYLVMTDDYIYYFSKNNLAKSTNSSNISTGEFEISNDGKTVNLIGFGKIIIKSIKEKNITIELNEVDSSESIELLAEIDDNILIGTVWTATSNKDGYIVNTLYFNTATEGIMETTRDGVHLDNSGPFKYENTTSSIKITVRFEGEEDDLILDGSIDNNSMDLDGYIFNKE